MPELTIPQKEPAAIIAAIGAAATVVIGLAVAFGAPITPDQQSAILIAIPPIGILVVLLVTRPKVTPAAAVAAQVNLQTGAIEAGPAAAQRDGTAVTVESVPIHPPPSVLPPADPDQRGTL